MRRWRERRRERRVPVSLRLPTPRWPTVTPPTVPGGEVAMHCHDCATPVVSWWWVCRSCGAVQDPGLDDTRHGLHAATCEQDALIREIRLAAETLRASLGDLWIHLMCDRPWPLEVAEAQARLARRGHTEKPDIVDVDPADEQQFADLLAVLPYVLHAEASCDGALVLAVEDFGGSLWCAPDRAERAALARAMDSQPRPLEDVFAR